MASAKVTRAPGLRFDAAVRGHIVSTDQPQSAGGADTAPTPLELLDAALGSCIALYLVQFGLSRGLSVDGLLVEVTSERAAGSPKRIGRFDVRVELPAGVPAHLLPAIERVVRTCPVHNTLTSTPENRAGGLDAGRGARLTPGFDHGCRHPIGRASGAVVNVR